MAGWGLALRKERVAEHQAALVLLRVPSTAHAAALLREGGGGGGEDAAAQQQQQSLTYS